MEYKPEMGVWICEFGSIVMAFVRCKFCSSYLSCTCYCSYIYSSTVVHTHRDAMPVTVVTPAKEIVFTCACVCLSVCLSVYLSAVLHVNMITKKTTDQTFMKWWDIIRGPMIRLWVTLTQSLSDLDPKPRSLEVERSNSFFLNNCVQNCHKESPQN